MFHISIYPKRLISTKWQQYGIDTREIDIQSLYTLSDFPCATVVFMATEKPLKKNTDIEMTCDESLLALLFALATIESTLNIWKEDKTAKAIHNFNAHIYLLCLQLVVIQMTPLEFTVWALTPDWMIWWKITPNNNIFLKSLPSPCCFYVCLLLISVLWEYFPIKFHQSSLLEWGLWGKLCTTMQKCIRPIHKIHRTSKLCT